MIRLTSIRAISFDVDGTLWDFETAARSALGHVLAELERLDPKAAETLDVATFVEIRDRAHDELRGVITDLNEIRRESFRRVLSGVGRRDDALAARLADLYFRHKNARIRLYDDVLPTLEALRFGYTLGVLSNGNTYPSSFGLDGIFAFAVFSQDHGGIEKPDPRLFEIAVGEAGCARDELLHVGDDPEYDVLGARNAGVRCVWLNRDGDGAHSDVAPDAEIASLLELVGVLSPEGK